MQRSFAVPASLLDRPTLVLNRHWQAVNISTASRAITLAFSDAARIVDHEDFQAYAWSDWARMEPQPGEPFLQSVRMRVRVPEVVVLTQGAPTPSKSPALSRRNLFRRDRSQCQYCGAKPGTTELSIDHLIPRDQGGESTWENCVLACVECRTRKGDGSIEQAGLQLLRPARRPPWKPMFASPKLRLESWSRFLSAAYWNVPLAQ
jgi:5-methylcytosine-specific restriction endonuclease McrA